MSEMTLFQSGAQLPAHLKQTTLSDLTRSLMGNDNKRISIEGGTFRMIVGGQEVAAREERWMNVVIVRAAEHNTRSYYAGAYKRGEKTKPTCWSDDSVKPNEDVKDKQHNNCQQCPQNIKGSGQLENSRACRYQRRLAVVMDNDMGGGIFAMSIPAASLFGNGEGRKMGLQQYARFIGGHGIDVNAIVTEMRFDTDSSSPKLTFSAVRPLEANEWQLIVSRKDEEAAVNAVTMTIGALDETGEETIEQKPAPAPAPAPVAAPKATPQPKAAVSTGFVVNKKDEKPAPVAEPTVRETKPAAPAPAGGIDAVLSAWGDDADD
jgi:hypothetical protein